MNQSVNAEESKTCPYCAEVIKAAATKCRYCHSDLASYDESSQGVHGSPSTASLPKEMRNFEPTTLWFYVQLDSPKSNITLEELSGLDQETLMDHIAKLMHAGMVNVSVQLGSSGIDFYRIKAFSDDEMKAIRIQAGKAAIPSRDHPSSNARVSRPSVMVDAPSDAPPPSAQRTPSGTPVPLTKWRGLSHMTRRPSVDVRCNSCKNVYSVEGAAANAVADQQGAGSRMMRWGTRTEQLGATFTVGASGRRIAAGNESERLNASLAAAHSFVACPRCSSTDVTLYKQ